MSYCYKYPRPAVTVDALVVSSDGKVLLVRRKNPPFEGRWALPGGFVDMDETPKEAVVRELQEETGLQGVALQQFRTYGAVDRDPRHRTISIVFWGRAADSAGLEVRGGDDAAAAAWWPLDGLPPLAFDHGQIIEDLKERI